MVSIDQDNVCMGGKQLCRWLIRIKYLSYSALLPSSTLHCSLAGTRPSTAGVNPPILDNTLIQTHYEISELSR